MRPYTVKTIGDPHYLVVTTVANGSEGLTAVVVRVTMFVKFKAVIILDCAPISYFQSALHCQ